jgi:hypothetical protein
MTHIGACSQCQKVWLFFPISKRLFPIQGTKNKISKIIVILLFLTALCHTKIVNFNSKF